MKRTHPLLVFVLPALSLLVWPGAPNAKGPARWERAPFLAKAVVRAAKAQRRLLVKVSTAWCSSCRKLDRVLSDSKVVGELAGYLRLAYDAEVGEGRDVARRYNVITFPTLLVIGADGLERDRITGYKTATKLLERLAEIKSGRGTLARLEKELTLRPGDLALRLRVGTGWALKGQRVPAEKHLSRVVAADPRNAKGLAARALLVRGKYLLLRSLKRFEEAEQVLRDLRRRFPASPEARRAAYPLARALHGQKRTAAAIKLLVAETRRAGKASERAEAHQTVAWFCLSNRVALDEGLRQARLAVKLAPKDASSWATLAQLLQAKKQREQALRAWQKAIKLDPNDAWYRRRRDQLRRLISR